MDSTLLRLILLVVGILVLVGIYWWETRRRQGSSQAKSRSQADSRQRSESELPGERQRAEMEDPDNIEAELARLSQEVKTADVQDDERIPMEVEARESPAPLVEQQEMFGFSAEDALPLDVPNKIIQINLMAKGKPFAGPAILDAASEYGLQPGEMRIFHRYTSDGRKNILYNVASMVEPGVFPLQEMEGFATPGLTFFTQLPGSGDGLATFTDMLYTAERLAARLGGVLQDETHSTLTKQTIETLRSEILEHRRLVQLARKKR